MNLEIAHRLTSLRKNANLSQEMLAEKLNVSRQAVSKWERGEACPDMDNLIQLAELYQISLDGLIRGREEPEAFPAGPVLAPAPEDPSPLPCPAPQKQALQISIRSFLRQTHFPIASLLTCGCFLLFLIFCQFLDRFVFFSDVHFSFGYLGHSIALNLAGLIFLVPSVCQTIKNAILGVPVYAPSDSVFARFFLAFPYSILTCVIHLFGLLTGNTLGWWLVYLTVPVYHWAVQRIFRWKKENKFQTLLSFPISYPVLFFVMIPVITRENLYAFWGLLVIPVYYSILFLVKRYASSLPPLAASKEN